MSSIGRAPPTVRLAEVLAAVSLAADVGHDQPLEKSLRNAVIAARLGDELGVAREERSAAYYVALLRSMGCTGELHETAVLFGGDQRGILGVVQELAGGDAREWARARRHVARGARAGRYAHRAVVSHGRPLEGRNAGASACEVSTTLARRSACPLAVQAGLDQVYERWDGRARARSAARHLCVPARVSHVVDVVEIACAPAACRRRAS